MYLNYNLKTPEERLECVNKVLKNTKKENLTPYYKKYIADYLLFITEKNQTKKEKKEENPIITKNREATINKRQVSYEQVVSSLENGEDGIYALIKNDKNQLLDNKEKLTQKDIDEIPGLKEQLELIETLKQAFKKSTGQKKFQLKKQIIETGQQIYILKASTKSSAQRGRVTNQIKTMAKMDIPEDVRPMPDGTLEIKSPISLLKPEHISFLLCYYQQLKQECADDLMCDMHWLLIDLENLVDKTLEKYAVLYDLLVGKIDGLTNEEIQEKMMYKHGIIHNEQYYSTLGRKRIPKLLAEQAQKDGLVGYYSNVEYGDGKYCNRCGQYKLAHPMFFSKNTSKSGGYSICKDCRSKNN